MAKQETRIKIVKRDLDEHDRPASDFWISYFRFACCRGTL